MDLQTRKISFIQEFLKLQSEEIINSLEKMLKQKQIELNDKHNISVNKLDSGNERFWEAIKPIKKSSSIKEMIEAQNYKPINKESFYSKTSELNITEPLDELLAMLSK